GGEDLLLGEALQSLTCQFMCRICFTAYITNYAPTAPASFANFVHCDAKAIARRHSAADHWSAIRAHDHTVIRPARGGKIERARGHVEEVAQEDGDRPTDRRSVLQTPAERSPFFPYLFEILKAGDAARGERRQRSRANSIDANLVTAEVSRQISSY